MNDRMNERFLKACRREPTDCVPVWFMRQAGRYMEEYRQVRAGHSILEVCKTPELAAQVTLQPIDRFPLDAAIIFADILLPVELGAQAVLVFDSWVGALSPDDYLEYVQPHVNVIFEGLKTTKVPCIHFGTGTSTLLELMKQAGGSVIGVDWRIPLDEARHRLGDDVAIQGNLDPVVLFT